MTFKPMLAATMKDTSKLRFPLLASQKLDGIRATVQGGRLLSRTLKPIPNENVQSLFKGLPEGLDGELIVGDPLAPDAYRKTVSLVMSDDKPLDWFKDESVSLHVFDLFGSDDFSTRLKGAITEINKRIRMHVFNAIPVEHKLILTIEELDEFEAGLLAKGAEGVMLRSLDGPYKQGRSTENEGYLVKVKRFVDSEAEIIGVFEEMENTNEKQTNELGRSKRSTEKAGLVPKGTLGGFEVRDLKTGVDFSIGAGFTAAERKAYWNAPLLIGQTVKYKYFPSGSKDKPRHPIYLGMRHKEDM
jgi:DNA ligase-1